MGQQIFSLSRQQMNKQQEQILNWQNIQIGKIIYSSFRSIP